MFFTQKDAEAAAKAIGLDFSAEKFTVDDLLAGMNAELRHGTKAGSANVTNDDPTMTAKLAVSNLRGRHHRAGRLHEDNRRRRRKGENPFRA